MRLIDAATQAHLESGETTLATCFRLVRMDGVVLGFTDHDAPITRGGVTYDPACGADGSVEPAELGPKTATSEMLGVLSHAALDETDILAGRYDGARVETWRVNWRAPEESYLRRVDTIGEIVREDGRFRAELRSPAQALNRVEGRIYHALCDARLGDARCGFDTGAEGFSAEVTVLAVADEATVAIAARALPQADWFVFGTLSWLSGGRTGLIDSVAGYVAGETDQIRLARRHEGTIAPGDTALLVAGCDRQFSTCREKFANAAAFRGFPHIPGSDYVLRYPQPGGARNGRPVVP
jgi:uncharacterized phage protein (TIGR02218 family)